MRWMAGVGYFFPDLADRDSKGNKQFSKDQFPPDITQDDQDKTADKGSRNPGGDVLPQKVVLLTLMAYVSLPSFDLRLYCHSW